LLKDPELLVFREFNCLYLVYGAVTLLKYGINGRCKIYMVSYYKYDTTTLLGWVHLSHTRVFEVILYIFKSINLYLWVKLMCLKFEVEDKD
jgi:hypothetical protein